MRWNKIAVNDLLNFFIVITILVCNTELVWYNETFIYYSNSLGFYAIHFLGKKLFWCYMMYNWDVKIPGKEKKTIVRNTNLVRCLLDCLFCLSKLLLELLPWRLSPPLFSPLFRASPGTLRIATLLFHYPLLYARPMRRVKK